MSQAALERQIRPIYDALDTGANKSAIQACNKILKKNPNLDLVKALKALAVVRTNKIEESLPICDEVLAAKPTDLDTLTAMMHVLRVLGRHADTVTMFNEAFKKQPNDEELGGQSFFANVRAGNWKYAQQVATKMLKQFKNDRYVYWSAISAVLQANDSSTPALTRTILYKLAHRLLSSSPLPAHASADRLYLHLMVHKELGLYDDALALLEAEEARAIVKTSLVVEELRRGIVRSKGLLMEEGERAEKKIVEDKDRNWLEFLSVLDATFSYVAPTSTSNSSQSPVEEEERKTKYTEHVDRTSKLFATVAELDGRKDRAGLLGLLELTKRARKFDVASDPVELLELMKQYLKRFGDKACCFEDLKPYEDAVMDVEGDEMKQWTEYLDTYEHVQDTPSNLQRSINAHKLRRHILLPSEITLESEISRARMYIEQYLKSLALGVLLPDSELQPADDLVVLAVQAWVGAWKISGDAGYLYNAVTALEYATSRSKSSYIIRLHLIQLYRLLGAPSLALPHYRGMNVKQVQNDTLSHYILSRASTYALCSTGDLTWQQECLESSQIYVTNSTETADFIVRAFAQEKYSQITDFIAFEEQLDNSLQRDLVKVEHVRMRLSHVPIAGDVVDSELLELKFIFDRLHHDNRDFDVLPNYQPRCIPSFNDQTLMFGSSPGLGWLMSFFRIFIRVFQLASDINDEVEEKVLIGDPPKYGLGQSAPKEPLQERLQLRKPDELAELTQDERALFDYGMTLCDWLEPFHDYVRPPPDVVMAEAAKQADLRLTKAPRITQNTTPPNGHMKKTEEPPAVKDAPESIVRFFDDMAARFKDVADENHLPWEALHVASITQEAYLIFIVVTTRFKDAAIVKMNKLGLLTTMFKEIRSKAQAVMKQMSVDLVKLADRHGSSDSRKMFMDACLPLQAYPELDHDYVFGIAKKLTDARKKVSEGVGKGMIRVIQLAT